MRLALTCNIKKGDEAAGGSSPLPPIQDDHYAEWDDRETIEAIRSALGERHEEVTLVEADEDAYPRLRELRPELVFNMAEGLTGESRESHIPSVLEMLGIPYTGSAPLTLSLCLNKARAKQVLGCSGVPTPRFTVLSGTGNDTEGGVEGVGLVFPLMVKPLYEGSSKGIRNDSLVRSGKELGRKVASTLEEYCQPVLVEEYLDGREFTVALMGNGRELRALPLVEINHSALPADINPIYSYEAKWILDRPEAPLDIFTCPADVDEGLRKRIAGIAEEAYRALGVKDWCRVDVRLDSGGEPNIIELNPLPGILPDPTQNSCFPKAARAEGMDFTELVNSVVDIARKRYGI
ncbi:MAG: D-alanine--D-alanine ligase [Thermodesulfobacteriota bacterium]